MRTVISNTIRLVKTKIDREKKFPREVIPYLLKAVDNADNKTRNDIENKLVHIGEDGLPALIEAMSAKSGAVRALIAMVLIRIGKSSILPLRQAYQGQSNYEWIVSYIIDEIEGTRKPLKESFEFNSFQAVLAS